jgi:hypothetical protein
MAAMMRDLLERLVTAEAKVGELEADGDGLTRMDVRVTKLEKLGVTLKTELDGEEAGDGGRLRKMEVQLVKMSW